MGFIWLMDDTASPASRTADVARWVTFAFTLYAGLTMVTNVPFYSFKDVQHEDAVPFVVIVLIALGIAVINIHPPGVLFGAVRRLRRLRLRRVRLEEDEGQARQRDCNIDRRTRRAGLAPLTTACAILVR